MTTSEPRGIFDDTLDALHNAIREITRYADTEQAWLQLQACTDSNDHYETIHTKYAGQRNELAHVWFAVEFAKEGLDADQTIAGIAAAEWIWAEGGSTLLALDFLKPEHVGPIAQAVAYTTQAFRLDATQIAHFVPGVARLMRDLPTVRSQQ